MLPTVIPLKRPIAHLHLPLGATNSPVVSESEFKNSMSALAFSIAVVTARGGNEEIGRTITSFMPLSAVPPRIMISIDVRSRLIDLIGASKSFSVSFLSDKHQDVGDAFAGRWLQSDRFKSADWDFWPSGNRRLVGAVLSFDCELTSSIDATDHMLFVGTIVHAEAEGAVGHLLWNERSYATLRCDADTCGEGSPE